MTDHSCSCGCCTGRDAEPRRPVNRPGLTRLSYRVARHNAFLDAMLERLSASDLPALQNLTTRDPSDLSIALLDAWAVIGDVLTFYEERIANEGYLATATRMRSVLGLGRLVGYEPRPGVAASVYLAYTLEADHRTVIPKGTRVQSVPGPQELPQVFETSEPTEARAAWNELRPRLRQPQIVDTTSTVIYLAGTATRLTQGDMLIIDRVQPSKEEGAVGRVSVLITAVEVDDVNQRTKVTLGDAIEMPGELDKTTIGLGDALKALAKAPATPPTNPQRLARDQNGGLQSGASGGTTLLGALRGIPPDAIATALGATPGSAPNQCRVYAMRVKARLFGYNAPPKVTTTIGEVDVPPNIAVPGAPANEPDADAGAAAGTTAFQPDYGEWTLPDTNPPFGEDYDRINLDNAYEQVQAGGYIVIRKVDVPSAAPFVVKSVTTVARSAYGMSGRSTLVVLNEDWTSEGEFYAQWAKLMRGTVVHAAPEELTLADEPVDEDICGRADKPVEIELDRLYDGLGPGRWVVVTGERTEPRGVHAAELAMLAGVRHDVAKIDDNKGIDGPRRLRDRPGDTRHTFISLAGAGLAYCYRRSTVVVRGNVVHATHGETRRQVLGSGDATVKGQSFGLKDPPLTYVSAPTATGSASTLEVRVNEVRWEAAPSMAALGPDDQSYLVRRGDDGSATVVFGSGERGALLPTGSENVRAVYRRGIGRQANVGAERLTTLTDRPLGVSAVVNPQAATGGADPETTATARTAIPLPLTALDRLVSVGDFAAFSTTFAGVGKASAAKLSDGRRQLIHVSVAGVDDGPLADDGDVLSNLRLALHALGDPLQPLVVERRELLALVMKAKVRLDPRYLWELVEPKLRATLLEHFSFGGGAAQDVTTGEVLSVMQRVAGVVGVHIDAFDAVSDRIAPEELDDWVGSPLTVRSRVSAALARVTTDATTGRRQVWPAQPRSSFQTCPTC